jgi:hypothetical protein
MRAFLTIIASFILVSAAWAATRWEPPSTSRYIEGSGGSSVGVERDGAIGEDAPRAATGATTGAMTAVTSTGALTGGSTSTGGPR